MRTPAQHENRTRPRRARQLLGASCLLVATLTGCGAPGHPPGTAPAPAPKDPGPRMRQVAEAWQGTRALAALRAGFYPLERLRTVLPEGGLRSLADRTAHLKGAYVAAKPLPAVLPEGEAVWPDGTKRKARALSAAETVDLLGEGDNAADGGHTLKVTGARLGETRVATSRGPARVPAWLFTVEGYDTPFTHPALARPEFPESPVAPLPRSPDRASASTGGPDSVVAQGRTLTVTVSHGGCAGPAEVRALESGDTIVLAVSVRPPENPDGPDRICDAAMHVSRATVQLERPVGDRVLLEADQGTPVQQSRD